MTEKEKMRAGVLYDANNDKALEAERTHAKALCHEFNMLSPAEVDRGREILKRLFGKTAGDKFLIQPSFSRCRYSGKGRKGYLKWNSAASHVH